MVIRLLEFWLKSTMKSTFDSQGWGFRPQSCDGQILV
jgi:hypothetical protein